MKVKVGNKIYDAEEEPIMIIFNSEEEKSGIALQLTDMQTGLYKYCMYPDSFNQDEIKEFMMEYNTKKILPYDEWYKLNEEEINIILAETGADREMDFDSEKEFNKRYEIYLLECECDETK